jgi:membrane associated rhomboid family serine protease
MKRVPVMNWLIIIGTVIAFLLQPTGDKEFKEFIKTSPYVLRDWTLEGLFGHIWLHAGWLHLIGNMFFLWVFGGAICSKVGNGAYPLVYISLGLLSGAAHLAMDGRPAVGASGAVNGIVGMFLIFYALSDMRCILIIGGFGTTTTIPSVVMIVLFVLYDILGAAFAIGPVAYWGHLGGFGAGVILAILLIKLGLVTIDPGEVPLVNPPSGARRSKEAPLVDW